MSAQSRYSREAAKGLPSVYSGDPNPLGPAVSDCVEVRAAPSNLLRRLLRGGLLFGSSATENACEGVIALVTSVFINLIPTLCHVNLRCPGSCPFRRIIDREFIQESVRVDAGEAFDQLHGRAGPCEARLAGEIGRFDDQRVAFPVRTRNAQSLADR